MRKLFAFVAILGLLSLSNINTLIAQDGGENLSDQVTNAVDNATDAVGDAADAVGDAAGDAVDAAGDAVDAVGDAAGDAVDAASDMANDAANATSDAVENTIEAVTGAAKGNEAKEVDSLHQAIKQTFIEGGAFFMSFVLICLILGLALAIERIIYLNMATTNTSKLVEEIEDALQSGGIDKAKDICRNTRGPVASIFFQGLDRSSGDYDEVAKAIDDYGSIEMSRLEKGLSWISLFIALAPMLGFMGTVIGMIGAFNDIAEANNISPTVVAGGIKVALITTVSGLIVAIILQIFYNYILAKIDSIVLDMEEASMDLIDILYKRNLKG